MLPIRTSSSRSRAGRLTATTREGRTTGVSGNGVSASYLYDPEGNRVEATVNGVTYDYIYDVQGNESSVIDASTGAVVTENYWIGSQKVAVVSQGSTFYVHTTPVGTVRALTGSDASIVGSDQSYPFGDGYAGFAADPDDLHFAGLTYDSETGLDHAWARQYSSADGRWMTPDPYSGSYDLGNPQSMDRYAYVLNAPLTLSDTSGLQANSCYICVTWGSGGTPASDDNWDNGFGGAAAQFSGPGTFDIPESIFSRTINRPSVRQSLENLATFSSGAGDFLSFGITKRINRRDGGAAFISHNSKRYTAGKVTGVVLGTAIALGGGGTAAAVADGKNGAYFGRGTSTVFNSSQVRFGWGWIGDAKTGADVIRLGIGAARGTQWWSHFIFWLP